MTEEDPFASLLPPRAQHGPPEDDPDLMFSETPVLSLPAEAQQVPEQEDLSQMPAEQNGPQSKPMGESRSRREARETEEVVKAVVGQMANGIAKVLESTNRRLNALEESTEALRQLLVDLGKSVEANTRAAHEQGAAAERSFRDLARGIQLIRDKQELAEAHAELSKFSVKPSAQHLAATPAPEAAASPASSAASAQPASTLKQVASLPTPPPPVATAPSVPPASAPPAPSPAPTPQASAPPPQQYAPAPALQQQLSLPEPAPQPQYAPQQQPQQPPPVLQQQPQNVNLPPPQQQPVLQQASAPQQQYSAPAQAPDQYSAPQLPPPQQHQFSAPPLPPSPAGSYSQEQHAPPPPLHQGGFHGPPPPGHHGTPPPTRHGQPPPPYQVPQHGHEGGPPGPPPPQYAPQPPLPPRGPSSGPPQGLWRGPQPDPYSRPPPASPAGGARQTTAPQTRDVPLERVIDEVASMGFSRHEVRETVMELMNRGKTVDLNVVLDRLMNRGR